VLPVSYSPLVPGEEAILFLQRERLGWRLVEARNAALHARYEDLTDLRTVVSSGAKLRWEDPVAEREWRHLAASLPGPRDYVLDALASEPLPAVDRLALAEAIRAHPPTRRLDAWLAVLGDAAYEEILRQAAAVVELGLQEVHVYRQSDAMGRILELLGEPIPDLQDTCGLARAELLRRHWSAAMEKHFPGLDLELMRRRLAAEEEWRRAMLDEIQTVYAR
jgi:hypothetical protein